jgi:hypothetical protein
MPHGWDGEAVTIRWTSSTPLLRKMLMASRLPTGEVRQPARKTGYPAPNGPLTLLLVWGEATAPV